MNISVIISTWNNSKRLKISFEAFERCEVPQGISWELVIVNNNCSDATDSVVKDFSSRLPIVYVKEPVQGLSRARNAGLKASTGKLLIFGDDDIEPCKEWLKLYWQAYQQNSSRYYWGGPITSDYEKGALAAGLIPFAPASVKGFDLGHKEVAIVTEAFLAANWACPSVIIKDLGGFNIEMGLDPSSGKVKTGEETELMKRLDVQGWRALYIPEASIKHFVPLSKMTLKHIASRFEAYGFYSADEHREYLKHSSIFGVPRWLLKDLFVKRLTYSYKRILGAAWEKPYVEFRQCLGLVKGLRSKGQKPC